MFSSKIWNRFRVRPESLDYSRVRTITVPVLHTRYVVAVLLCHPSHLCPFSSILNLSETKKCEFEKIWIMANTLLTSCHVLLYNMNRDK